MTRKRTTYAAGLAILAIVAFVVAAAVAHTPAQFEFPGGGKTVVESKFDGNHEIDIPGWGTIVCKHADFAGTVTGASATKLLLEPSFEECTLGGEPLKVNTGACWFEYKADGGFSITTGPKGDCALEPIEITLVNEGCELIIGPQNLTGIGYTNINKEEEITLTMTITKLQGVREGCEPTGSFNSGQYTAGNTILTGTEDPGGKKRPIKWAATVP